MEGSEEVEPSDDVNHDPEAEVVPPETLKKDPELLRAIDLYVQQNVEQHLHLREREMLPDPTELEAFNKVVPGLAQTAVDEWKIEADHRRRMEASVFEAQRKGLDRGQWMGFVLTILFILTAIFLFIIGKNAVAFFVVLSVLLIAASRLVGFPKLRSRRKRRDSDEGSEAVE